VELTMAAEDTALLLTKLEELNTNVEYLVARQRKLEELVDELMPIGKLALTDWSERLAALEERGYFEFAEALVDVVDHVVTGFTPDDVHDLADNVVHILDTVRNLTQADTLEALDGAAEAVHEAGDVKPVGVVGMLRATRSDDDVRRGLAVSLEALRHIGRAARKRKRDGERKISPLLGGKRNLQRRRTFTPSASRAPRERAPTPAPSAAPTSAPAAPAATAITIDGVALDHDGFLADPGQWSEDLASQIAEQLGLGELSDDHWRVLRFARSEYLDKGSSPNIRRITTGADVTTKELYALFPKGPAKTAARVAGIPKPVGCI
jgi:tRNA 2-thiouridine synthesizing protein E